MGLSLSRFGWRGGVLAVRVIVQPWRWVLVVGKAGLLWHYDGEPFFTHTVCAARTLELRMVTGLLTVVPQRIVNAL